MKPGLLKTAKRKVVKTRIIRERWSCLTHPFGKKFRAMRLRHARKTGFPPTVKGISDDACSSHRCKLPIVAFVLILVGFANQRTLLDIAPFLVGVAGFLDVWVLVHTIVAFCHSWSERARNTSG